MNLRFGYWSDPLCVWAFVAQPNLDAVLEDYSDRLDVEYRIVPVFGSIPWRFREGAWAQAGPEGRAEATRRIAAEHGHPEVTGEVWTRDMPASSWPCSAAVKAVARLEASESVPPGSTARYLNLLRRRFFVENLNVARRSHQMSSAEELGLPRGPLEALLGDGTAEADLWEDHLEKERLRLQGSPSYVFDGGRVLLYGNFPAGILRATLEQLLGGTGPGGTCC